MARPLAALALLGLAGLAACAGDDGGAAQTSSEAETSASSTSSETSSGTETEGTTTSETGPEDMGTGETGDEEPVDPIELPPSDPPVAVPEGTLFSEGVSCGPHPENVFDVFLPASAEPTALVVFIHGGGFTGGSRTAAYGGMRSAELIALVEAGVAFATIDYRLLEQVDDEGVIKPLGDSRYCLQFLRYHAESLNIDPERVATYGSSAGAGTSLWLATHDDMAEPEAEDPVERQSTRPRAIGILETQATYDILRWLDDIFAPYVLSLDVVVMAGLEQRLLSFYGIDTIDQLESPEIVAYREDVDMLDLMDASSAPVWILSDNQPESIPLNTGLMFHHPYHAEAVMDEADAKGVENVAYIPVLGIEDPSGETLVEFMLRQLEVQ